MNDARVLVAGIGNVFFGDDGFGVEVAMRLLRAPPPRTRVLDIGIRSIDLAFALQDGWDATILIDAMPRGREPGTLYVLQPDLADNGRDQPLLDAHGIHPEAALRAAMRSGARLGPIRIVGCEPQAAPDDSEAGLGLTPRVRQAVEPAVDLVWSLVSALCPEATRCTN